MSLLTSLAGPVLGLVGKLFGSKKKEETVNRVDYARMVADAEAAGFNPLTALRNGGSAGFSVTSHPVLSSREVIGQAMGEVGNFLSNFDPFADQKREAEFNLVQAQIRNLNASSDALARSQSFNVPSYSAGAVERRPSGTAAQLAPSTWDRVTAAGAGWSWGINPANTPAQEVEDQYAEIPANIVGTANWLDDMRREYTGENKPYELPNFPKIIGDWWQGAASADYERHKAKYARPRLAR